MSEDFDDDEYRDRPLTMDWRPLDPDAYAVLGLPKLSRRATEARNQLITEALVAGPNRFTSYSRRREFYARRQRYFRKTYSYRSIIPAVDQLGDVGLFDNEKVPPGHRGRQSRFRGSEILFGLRPIEVVYDPLELILVRDFDGFLMAYRDNRETRRMRKNLKLLNENLVSQEIAVDGRVIREGDQLDNGGIAQTQMCRIFNRGGIAFGGRFYGGHWQNIPSAKRKTIAVNGSPTSEIDYISLHVRLLYQEAGKQMVGDPYEIDGWPREYVKQAMLIAINATKQRGAVAAIAQWLTGRPGGGNRFDAAKALLAAVKAKHPDIAKAFGSDAGARLMRKDSDIAEAVMVEMLNSTGIVPLCMHDAFIVPSRHESRLVEAMDRGIGIENSAKLKPPAPAQHADSNTAPAIHRRHAPTTVEEKRAFYLELVGYQRAAKKKDGTLYAPTWARAKYRRRMHEWPPRSWADGEPSSPPSEATIAWINDCRLDWVRNKAKRERLHRSQNRDFVKKSTSATRRRKEGRRGKRQTGNKRQEGRRDRKKNQKGASVRPLLGFRESYQ